MTSIFRHKCICNLAKFISNFYHKIKLYFQSVSEINIQVQKFCSVFKSACCQHVFSMQHKPLALLARGKRAAALRGADNAGLAPSRPAPPFPIPDTLHRPAGNSQHTQPKKRALLPAREVPKPRAHSSDPVSCSTSHKLGCSVRGVMALNCPGMTLARKTLTKTEWPQLLPREV